MFHASLLLFYGPSCWKLVAETESVLSEDAMERWKIGGGTMNLRKRKVGNYSNAKEMFNT